nr:coagulation factor IX-like isoform X2 [Nomia melanderi]
MLRLVALACFASIALMISETNSLSNDANTKNLDNSFHRESEPFFLLHLLKLKKIQKVEKIQTAPPPTDCICVPYYLCSVNGTVTIDQIGAVVIRYRRCTGDLEVCCRLVNATTTTMKPTTKTTPTTMKTTPTTMKTTTTTLAPVIFPNTESPSAQVCVCVYVSQCDPYGVIGTSGEGVLNPRQLNAQCPTSGQVCCRPASVIVYNPPVPQQTCTICGAAIRCNNGVVIPVNVGLVNPLVSYSPQTCPVPNTCCGGLSPSYPNGIPVVLGPIRYPDTPQACYCMKAWLCSAGNSGSWDGAGAIDPRFSACSSADEVCCRPSVAPDPRSRDGDNVLAENIVNAGASFSQPGCGIRNTTYAPAQPYPSDSGRTYLGEFPWMVALLSIQADGKYLFLCGGSLITNTAILTAAHCATNGALFNDIAVVILDKPFNKSANVVPVCVPEQGLVFAGGTRCFGTGWGKNTFGGAYQTELRKVELPIVDRTDCQNRLRTTRLGSYFQLHSSFICAGGEANRDTCTGDGGGPLVYLTANGQYFQAGIVSWGIGCGGTNIPAVYTNVAQYTLWIDQQLATYGT